MMGKNMKGLTISDVVRQSGATEKQIRDWNLKGYLGPVIKEQYMGMVVYIYSPENLYRAKRIVELKIDGISPKYASLILDEESESN